MKNKALIAGKIKLYRRKKWNPSTLFGSGMRTLYMDQNHERHRVDP